MTSIAGSDIYRVADANADRVAEGLRVLEDVARFVLNEGGLSTRLKEMRHSVRRRAAHGLSSRDAQGDVVSLRAEDARREDLVSLVRANARRAQEGLRVLEELGKLENIEGLDAVGAKADRFAIYELERELVSRLQRSATASRIKGLYIVLDPSFCQKGTELDVARRAIAGGASVLQLRDKQSAKGEMLPLARELKKVCSENNVVFIVNDHVDLAIAAGADGVHLGQKDLPTREARSMLPIETLVGRSTATVDEARQAQAEGADYVAVGCIFPTTSKTDTRAAGLETLRKARAVVSAPLVAIGGINHDNIWQVAAAGADAVAVIRAVICAEDVEAAARELVEKMEESSVEKAR